MQFLQAFLVGFRSLDKTVLVPIVIFILSLVFRVKPSTAIKSALMFGAGLAGITIISNYMTAALAPVGTGIIANTGLTNDYMDLGMSPMFAGAVSLPFFLYLYPIGIVLNMILIRLRFTKTLLVDFINFATTSIAAVPVYIITGNTILTLIVFAIYFIIELKIADWTAPMVQSYYGVEGVSIPHPSCGFQALYVIPLNWLIDKIPGLNKIDFNMADVRSKLGIFGEPSVISFVIGFVLAMIAGLGIVQSLYVGMSLVAVMLLFPKAIGLLMEALAPISKGIKAYYKQKYGDEMSDLYMGMDAAIFSGYPEVVAITAVYIPIVVLLHFILPGVRTLPTGESLQLAIVIGMIVPFAGTKGKKGNVFRTLLIGIILASVGLYCSTYCAPIVTALARRTGMAAADQMVTSMAMRDPQKAFIYWLVRTITGKSGL